MTRSFDGVYPAFLTPLDQNRRFAPKIAELLLTNLMQGDFAGTYIAGSTGEGLRMSFEDRKLLLETLMPVLPAGKKMIVHVGTPLPVDAIHLAEHAAKHGAHAISSLPPVGTPEQVRAFYHQLAAKSPLPLILYYFPKVAPQAFEDPQQLLDICALPNVIGVKFTDFNMFLVQRLSRKGAIVFNGYDEAFAAGLLMGGIGSTYNIMPQIYQTIYRAAQSGDWETARTWQGRANIVIELLLRYPFFPALREIMRYRGFDCGPLLSRETLTSEAQRIELIKGFKRVTAGEMAELIG